MENKDIDTMNDKGKLPDQKELEKELSEYLSKKYGNRIKIISPVLFPKGHESFLGENGDDEVKKGDVPCI